MGPVEGVEVEVAVHEVQEVRARRRETSWDIEGLIALVISEMRNSLEHFEHRSDTL